MARSLRFERISIPSWLLAFSRRIRFSRNKTSAAAPPRGGHQDRRWQREGRCWAEIDHSKGNGQMNKSRRSPYTFVFAITLLVAFPSPSSAQLSVLISGGFSAPYQELLPKFEKSTGITATTAPGASGGSGLNGPITISAELQRGQPADVVILSREGLAELSAEGRIVTGSDAELASVPLGKS
jgi:hypothetical protein